MKKLLYYVKDYFLFIFLLLVSLFLISNDSTKEAFHSKRIFFGIFAYANSLFDGIFVKPLQPKTCEEAEKRAAELHLQNELLRLYGLENSELKQLLDYKKNSQFNLLTAEVISKNILPVKKEFTINRGSVDSVKLGMSVVTNKGFVGLITMVARDYSIVRTFEDPRIKITAEVERNGINGLVTWDGKNLVMKNIPTNYDVKNGDRIITSPLSYRYAHRIPLGIVKDKINSVSGLFSDLIIQPFNDLRTIRYCFVILNSDDKILQKVSQSKNEK